MGFREKFCLVGIRNHDQGISYVSDNPLGEGFHWPPSRPGTPVRTPSPLRPTNSHTVGGWVGGLRPSSRTKLDVLMGPFLELGLETTQNLRPSVNNCPSSSCLQPTRRVHKNNPTIPVIVWLYAIRSSTLYTTNFSWKFGGPRQRPKKSCPNYLSRVFKLR